MRWLCRAQTQQRSFSTDRSYQAAAAAAAAAATYSSARGSGGFDASVLAAAQQQQHAQQQQQPLDMGGMAGGTFDKNAGALRARDLLFPDSFALDAGGGTFEGLPPPAGGGGGASQHMNLGSAFLQVLSPPPGCRSHAAKPGIMCTSCSHSLLVSCPQHARTA
jgi:hypothetical protein